MNRMQMPWEGDIEKYLRKFIRGLSQTTIFFTLPKDVESRDGPETWHVAGALFWDPEWNEREQRPAPFVEAGLDDLDDPLQKGRDCRAEWGLDRKGLEGIGGVICIWVEVGGQPPLSVSGHGEKAEEFASRKAKIAKERWAEVVVSSLLSEISIETLAQGGLFERVITLIIQCKQELQRLRYEVEAPPLLLHVKWPIKGFRIDGGAGAAEEIISVADVGASGHPVAPVLVVLGEGAATAYVEARMRPDAARQRLVNTVLEHSRFREAAFRPDVPVIGDTELKRLVNQYKGVVFQGHIVNWLPDYGMPSCQIFEAQVQGVQSDSEFDQVVQLVRRVYKMTPDLSRYFGDQLEQVVQRGDNHCALGVFPSPIPVVEMVPGCVGREQEVAHPVSMPQLREVYLLNATSEVALKLIAFCAVTNDFIGSLEECARYVKDWPMWRESARKACQGLLRLSCDAQAAR